MSLTYSIVDYKKYLILSFFTMAEKLIAGNGIQNLSFSYNQNSRQYNNSILCKMIRTRVIKLNEL